MLSVEGLVVRYGAIEAVRGINLQVESGEIVGLIGVNGAGKSTTMLSIVGVVRPVSGAIGFDGRQIVGLSPEAILRQGIAPVMEGRRVFPSLTVEENLRLGAATVRDREQYQEDLDRWTTFFPILRERLHRPAGNLSGGQQQMLAVARALMSRPRLLLMDEPSLGLAPKLVAEIFQLIQQLRDFGMTILLIEQNVRMTLDIVDRVYLLNTGKVEFAGAPSELRASGDVEQAYLHGGSVRASRESAA
ncbi:MAG: ABC transporter ATP-binding protein [Thermomicrobiales bacterium]